VRQTIQSLRIGEKRLDSSDELRLRRAGDVWMRIQKISNERRAGSMAADEKRGLCVWLLDQSRE
jgi:hypothetical protein